MHAGLMGHWPSLITLLLIITLLLTKAMCARLWAPLKFSCQLSQIIQESPGYGTNSGLQYGSLHLPDKSDFGSFLHS